jgi:hypothetical protein
VHTRKNAKTTKKTHTAREMNNMRKRQVRKHLAKHVKHVNVVFQRALLHESVHLVHVTRLKNTKRTRKVARHCERCIDAGKVLRSVDRANELNERLAKGIPRDCHDSKTQSPASRAM